VDVKGVAWFYTRNPEFFSHKLFPGIQTQSEHPVASFEGQLSDRFKPWLGDYLDARSKWVSSELSEENILLLQSG
jgi:hypothetical protein